MLFDVLMDTVLDSVKMLPFLLAAFLLMEWLEKYSGEYMNRMLAKVGHAGPIVGALLGCIPQCGFSVVAANLYAGGILTPGTLLAVFLATSDEAVLIMLGHPGRGQDILLLLAMKVLIGTAAGYLIDFLIPKRHDHKADMERICADCGCHDHDHDHALMEQASVMDRIRFDQMHDSFTLVIAHTKLASVHEVEDRKYGSHDEQNTRRVVDDEVEERKIRCRSDHDIGRIADECCGTTDIRCKDLGDEERDRIDIEQELANRVGDRTDQQDRGHVIEQC